MRTQEQTLLQHLQTHGTITQREAITEYSIQSLTRRITTLRNAFHIISTTFKKNPITGQRYAQYALVPPTKPEVTPVAPAVAAVAPTPAAPKVGDRVEFIVDYNMDLPAAWRVLKGSKGEITRVPKDPTLPYSVRLDNSTLAASFSFRFKVIA